MKVSELEGALLDYWVARINGWEFYWSSKHKYYSITKPNGGRHHAWEGWTEYNADTGKKNKVPHPATCIHSCDYFPSELWCDGGSLIEKYGINLTVSDNGIWWAMIGKGERLNSQSGPTPLIAACRCIVASVYNEEVPDE